MNDNKEEEEEWDDKIKQYQLISHVKEINFDNLLRFWLIPIYIPNILCGFNIYPTLLQYLFLMPFLSISYAFGIISYRSS